MTASRVVARTLGLLGSAAFVLLFETIVGIAPAVAADLEIAPVAAPGDLVEADGLDWDPDSGPVSLTLIDSTDTIPSQQLGSPEVNADGAFSHEFLVPDVPAGYYRVSACQRCDDPDGPSNLEASDLQILAPQEPDPSPQPSDGDDTVRESPGADTPGRILEDPRAGEGSGPRGRSEAAGAIALMEVRDVAWSLTLDVIAVVLGIAALYWFPLCRAILLETLMHPLRKVRVVSSGLEVRIEPPKPDGRSR